MQRLLLACALLACSNTATAEPQSLVAAWPSGPLETRVTFTAPLDKEVAQKLVGTRIVFGDGVKAGDVHVERGPNDLPQGENRGSLRIAAAKLVDGGKTLVLATDPHSRDANYAFNLPTNPPLAVSYNLRGAEVIWDRGGADAKPEWTGWLPSVNAATSEKLPQSPGRLTLKTVLTVPKGKVSVRATASGPVEVSLGNESVKAANEAVVTTETEFEQLDLAIILTLDGKTPLKLSVTDATGKPLDAGRQTLPWAPPLPPVSAPVAIAPELIAGGDRGKGEAVFKSEAAKCVNCHKVRGVGGEVGPDLSSLIHRDRAWVYRNLTEPSAMIHPDYVPYTVLLKDGRVLSGIVRAEGADSIKVVDTEAKATVVAKSEIEELRPSATSIMPVGLTGAIGEAGVRDLIAFLTSK